MINKDGGKDLNPMSGHNKSFVVELPFAEQRDSIVSIMSLKRGPETNLAQDEEGDVSTKGDFLSMNR